MRPSRHRLATSLVALVLAFTLAPGVAIAKSPPRLTPPGSDALAQGSWIVTLEKGAHAADAATLSKEAGGKLGLVYEHALTGFQFKGSAAAATSLRHNPRVKSVEPDRAVYLTETLPFGVERTHAWSFSGDGAYQAGFRGAGARIAILDTGIDLDHPDLAASIDNAAGLNCLNTALPPNDGHGHGTHVAGTAAAPLNGVGVVGIAPEAQLVAIKMFDDVGNSSEALALCALDRVVALNTDGSAGNDIDVVNMSWGEHRAWGDCASDALHGAICAARAAGAVLVGGAGNDAVDAGDFVPAAFSEVISVSGYSDFDGQRGGLGGCQFVPSLFWTECDDTLAFFSDFGPSVDVVAPSVNVYSTWAGGGYKVDNGTSMATPHVTGIVALMAAADPDLTPSEALDILRTTGECPNGAAADADGQAGCAGQGTWTDDPDGIPEPLPNALRAAQAAGATPPPPPPQPTVPGTPTLLGASGGVSAISLSWTTPADGGSPITGYQVWRGTSAGGEGLLTTVGVQQGYTDSAVAAGTTYWYQVAAVNALGPSARSNELSARLITTPSAPTLLGAAADKTAVLSWTAPTSDGGGTITAYNVYRRVGAGTEAFLASTGGTETIYVDGNLANGTQYTYRVGALNAAGEGLRSNAVSVTPTAPNTITSPSPPSNLTVAKAKASNALVLKWAAPSSDGGSPLVSYFVYRRGPGESSFTLIGLTNASTRTYTDSAIARRSLYAYYVTAFNSYYESGHSNEVSIRSR